MRAKDRNALCNPKIGTFLGALVLACLCFVQPAQAQSGHYFIHTATAANIAGNVTYLDDPYVNGDPTQMLMATQDWSGVGVYNNHHIGVWYNTWLGRWAIFNQDLAPMPVNATFFVYDSVPISTTLTHVATPANINGNVTYIDNPLTNGHPEKLLFVTPKYNPNNVYANHAIGVWYNASLQKWAVFNQDRLPMANRAAFNVFVLQAGGWGVIRPDGTELTSIFQHIATAANSSGDNTLFNGTSFGQTGTWVFATPCFNPYSIYANHAIGVWFSWVAGKWGIFNQDLTAIPNLAAFNVWTRHFTPRVLH